MIRSLTILLACSAIAVDSSGQMPFTAGHYRTTDANMGGLFYHHGIEAPGGGHLTVVDIALYPPRLFRHSSSGATLWQQEFAAPALQHCFRPVLMPDSSIALGGINVDRCQLFHLGPDGSLLAAHQFPIDLGLYDLRPLGDDSLLMAGNIQHGENDYKGLFVTTDPAGAIGNAWSIGLGVHRTFFVRLVRAVDNGYFALAGCRDGITPVGTPDTIGAGLVRLDDNGQFLWAARFDNPERCLYPDDVIELADGDIMLACRVPLEDDDAGDPIDILRIAPTGSLRWAKRVWRSPALTIDPQQLELERWQDEEVILAGWTGSPPHVFVLRSDTSFMPLDGIQFDRFGTLKDAYVTSNGQLALTTLEGGPLTPNVMHCPTLMVSDGSAAFPCTATAIAFQVDPVAVTTTTGFSILGESIATTDITSLTTLAPSPDLPFDPCMSTGLTNTTSNEAITIWPDPAQDVVHVRGRSIERLDLFDAMGRLILSRSFTGVEQLDQDIGDLHAGLYHLWVEDKGIRHGHRLVKE